MGAQKDTEKLSEIFKTFQIKQRKKGKRKRLDLTKTAKGRDWVSVEK